METMTDDYREMETEWRRLTWGSDVRFHELCVRAYRRRYGREPKTAEEYELAARKARA